MSKITEKFAGLNLLFLGTVVGPTILAILYFGFLSSDVYVSESRFIVRSQDKSTPSGLSALFKSGGGFADDSSQAYAVRDFIMSRDALRSLDKDGTVLRAYSNGDVSMFNRFNAFGGPVSSERLFRYYRDKLEVNFDSASSITTLRVRGFSPLDAERINARLLELAENLVNRLNTRERSDLIGYANNELDEAKATARNAAVALSNYRNSNHVLNPEAQATVQLQMISKLQDELISAKTQLVQLRAFTPQNPQIPPLNSRIAELSREIDQQVGSIAGSNTSLAASAAQYQRVQLESQIADRVLGAAITSLQDARNEARRKRAYIERVAQPSTPDAPDEPKRFRGILSTLVVGLIAWGILTMLLAGVREHRD
jgi:BexC/CtrB/KpsE family polysaccharide export inner-membrane protein